MARTTMRRRIWVRVTMRGRLRNPAAMALLDFARPARTLPGILAATTVRNGRTMVRLCRTPAGNFIERGVRRGQKRLEYCIVRSNMRITDYRASIRLKKKGSIVLLGWQSRFLVDVSEASAYSRLLAGLYRSVLLRLTGPDAVIETCVQEGQAIHGL